MCYPLQAITIPNVTSPDTSVHVSDMRELLNPRRLTIVMWDQAYLLRHHPGGSFEDWDRVLDETIERGYNTIRIDALPHTIDLSHPDQELTWPEFSRGRFMPWCWLDRITCPAGRWMLEFMEKAVARGLWLELSTWWFTADNHDQAPPQTIKPENTMHGAELWANMLGILKHKIGFERFIFVDYANEMPFFFPRFMEQLNEQMAQNNDFNSDYSDATKAWLRDQLDRPLQALQAEFPELRFTHSIHGDPRWLSVGLTALDCIDAHFYSDADARWRERTRFAELIRDSEMFKSDTRYRDFSDRCAATYRAIGPMLHTRQHHLMRQFSGWSQTIGAPLVCTEGWSSWFYIDHPDLDWGWLIDYSKQAIDDAIACGFWGVTTSNYVQPQFALWNNIAYHRQLNEKFLNS